MSCCGGHHNHKTDNHKKHNITPGERQHINNRIFTFLPIVSLIILVVIAFYFFR